MIARILFSKIFFYAIMRCESELFPMQTPSHPTGQQLSVHLSAIRLRIVALYHAVADCIGIGRLFLSRIRAEGSSGGKGSDSEICRPGERRKL